jgi:hypothetical protein
MKQYLFLLQKQNELYYLYNLTKNSFYFQGKNQRRYLLRNYISTQDNVSQIDENLFI